MSLFNPSKIVVALFDNDQDVERAVQALQDRGFGREDDDQIRIIDQNRLTSETPLGDESQRIVPPPSSGTGHAVGPGIVYNPETLAGTDPAHLQDAAQRALTDLGVGEEEATFYAQQIARDNAVVIVRADPDHAPEVLSILEQIGTRASIS